MVEMVMEMVSAGKTVTEIGAAFGMSKSTFLRRKRADAALSAAYDAALAGRRSGGVTAKSNIAGDAVWAFEMPVNVERRVLDYVTENPGASFDDIANGLRIHEDNLSGVLPKLMLDDRAIYRSGNYRYYADRSKGVNEQSKKEEGRWKSGAGRSGRGASKGFAYGER